MYPESKLRIESLLSRGDSWEKWNTACPATAVGVIPMQPNSSEKQQPETEARQNQHFSGLFTGSLKCDEEEGEPRKDMLGRSCFQPQGRAATPEDAASELQLWDADTCEVHGRKVGGGGGGGGAGEEEEKEEHGEGEKDKQEEEDEWEEERKRRKGWRIRGKERSRWRKRSSRMRGRMMGRMRKRSRWRKRSRGGRNWSLRRTRQKQDRTFLLLRGDSNLSSVGQFSCLLWLISGLLNFHLKII